MDGVQGQGSPVGMLCPLADLCERVIVPSELGQTITMGLLAVFVSVTPETGRHAREV